MIRRSLAPLLLLVGTAAAAVPGTTTDPIDARLRARMAEAAPDERITAYVVLADQLTLAELDARTRGHSVRGRRAVVADALKAHADATQGEVRAVLAAAEAAGAARLHGVLWMGNAVIFEATADVIAALAALPGVDRIRPVVVEDASAYQDAATLLAPLGPYPLKDGFDSCTLAPYWTVATTGTGNVAVTMNDGPVSGCHVVMDSTVDVSPSTASITVALDLRQKTGVGIRFAHKEFNDEQTDGDGVFVSADGIVFHKVLPLGNAGNTYETKVIDLDQAVAALGISYTSSFHVRFQWADDYGVPTDGFAFDDIEIGPGIEPPPATIEPNIARLQAPALWELGYDGTGIVIANIDSGSDWTHPDLAQRVWQNPNDPLNGIDDDGNGKVDDVRGWDFADNDNNPLSLDTHGTQTAGLMVGDGTNGKITGMAPGGSMVICRINGETHYWLAQQYALEIGVDVVSSSHSFKWPSVPDYHMHRQLCAVELAAGIIHANSIGNQGLFLSTYPVPFNISAPGNCPSPFGHPQAVQGGRTSVLGCGGIHLDDSLYTSSGVGPAAWENVKLYSAGYPHGQDPAFWDYPYGGFAGGQPGLIKPDVVTFTDSVTSTTNGGGYSPFGGTSAATPQLGGALMLLRQVQPEALPRHLAGAVELTAHDLGPAGKDTRYGAGRLQTLEAARRLVLLGRVDDPSPGLGDTITIELFGEAGASALAFVAAQFVDSPVGFDVLPPYIALGPFTLDANGEAAFGATIPNDPSLAGATFHLQFAAMPVAGSPWGGKVLLSVPETIRVD